MYLPDIFPTYNVVQWQKMKTKQRNRRERERERKTLLNDERDRRNIGWWLVQAQSSMVFALVVGQPNVHLRKVKYVQGGGAESWRGWGSWKGKHRRSKHSFLLDHGCARCPKKSTFCSIEFVLKD